MQLSSVFCNYIEHINWTKCSYPRTVSFDFMIIQQIHINQLSGKDIYYKDKYYTWQSCISSLLLTVTLSIDQSNKGVNVLNQMKRQIMKQQNKTYYNKQKHLLVHFLHFTQTRIQFSGQSPWERVLCGFKGLDWLQREPEYKFLVKWENSIVTANIFEFW